ncbi:MAG: 4-hydroxy-tetrahydrodipicolinate reductase [Oscillospiraceae bacterium]|nr:4-hydroxy-tetrahydrodipicolinate reductase [Oscillospiraceae bacterium]MBR7085153.1 4-hydroxy-tetrahydrodipicolinate reductase [Oscillospiraceae bacterium]
MKQVKILISGASGKMGHAVAAAVSEREDCIISAGIDLKTDAYADFNIYQNFSELPEKPDVIIDFSNPAALDNLLNYCLVNGVPCVLATTGYSEEQISQIKKASESIPVFFSFNMSLGINLLVQLAKKATSILGNQFDIEIVEKHHNQKLDAPSGTALMLADAINSSLDNQYHYVYDRHSRRQKREKSEIGLHAIRGGTIVGEHDIIFAGHDEVITLSHSAASKEVFAVGAVNAAVFLKDQKAGMFDMSALMSD